jgi:hypothetical protein
MFKTHSSWRAFFSKVFRNSDKGRKLYITKKEKENLKNLAKKRKIAFFKVGLSVKAKKKGGR